MRTSTFAMPLAFAVQLAAGNPTALSIVPSLHGVSVDDVGELLNTTEFSAIDATKWTTFLDQPHEVLAAWDPVTKHRMFSLLHRVLSLGTELERRGGVTVAEADSMIRIRKDHYDAEVETDEAVDKEDRSCIHSSTCVLCIGAAGSLAIGKIAGCGTAAFAAAAATAPEAPVTIGPILLGFVECSSPLIAAFLTATGACIEAVKHIG